MKNNIVTNFFQFLNEKLYNNIIQLENIFNVNICKILGDDSIGIAYLTSNKNVLKITPSISEYKISNKILNNPNIHFPKIFKIEKIDKKWYGIYKEYIPAINNKIKKDYLLLESELNIWLETDYDLTDYELTDYELIIHKLIHTKNSLFIDYLSDEYPNIIYLYQQLMDIVEYTMDIVDNNAVDIHIDNLGIKNNTIILFDY